ncbi:RNA-binding protein involved in export of mRNAs Hrb1 [Schizosaccharomyces osmophilus]|uniref:RNA-binding protein involved in export of mRNAs Hrb1 n=1 Tax=Schizosaccharomyces osmophilus TaxID=2545709 RepID=A0AAE9WE31_9SCHI|nr:RNA-binding protein involved in export of mRNAs Hrb1 [Schizosaccharomyces osmophilus]WBW74535.1 RNA-binding protein involved in export of mRNAs Hrb1 [Schizosaccharomyces osmophilus]
MPGQMEWTGTNPSYVPNQTLPATDRERSMSPRIYGDVSGMRKRGSYHDEEIPLKDPHLVTGKQNSQQERRVYVGNLSYQVRWYELKDFMKQAGHVLYAEILNLPNGLSKGCGIIEYSTSEEAQRAVETLSNKEYMGRLIYVREDREQEPKFGSRALSHGHLLDRGNDVGRQLFVGNLPYSVRWQDLKDLFRQVGTVVRADVQMNQDGRSRGIGIVLMSSAKDAHDAIEMLNNTAYMGRTLEVRLDRFAKNKNNSYPVRGVGFPSYSHDASSMMNNPLYMPTMVGMPPAIDELVDNAFSYGSPSNRVYVGNLPWATVNQDLFNLFGSVGNVVQAKIAHESNGYSRGYGVVEYEKEHEAADAIENLNGSQYGGRHLQVSYVRYGQPANPLLPSMIPTLATAPVTYPSPIIPISTSNSPMTSHSYVSPMLSYMPVPMTASDLPPNVSTPPIVDNTVNNTQQISPSNEAVKDFELLSSLRTNGDS